MLSAAAYLDVCRTRGIRLDLGPMRALAAALGHPERAFPTLLVAGTNGKGSVVAYVEAVLRASGHVTGRFTSPPLRRIEEQICVGGCEIDTAELDAAVDDVRRAAEAVAVEPSAFEALAAAAFVRFRRARVDVAVVEVGLGAAGDATNVAEPIASAIVTLAKDHERFLGDDLRAIARAKAGVLRAGRMTVIGPLPSEACTVVLENARALGARVVESGAGVRVTETPEGLRVTTPVREHGGLRPLPGAHQRDNLLVALRLVEAAHEAGLRVDFDALPAAIARVRWPGRLQWLEGRPPLLLDGAHNPAGALALAAYLRDRGPLVLLFGAMEDKDVEGMGAALFPLAQAVVLTRADDAPRAARPESLRDRGGRFARALHLEADVDRALALAQHLALGLASDTDTDTPSCAPGPPVVVAGSLSLVGAVLGRLEDASGATP